MNQKSIQSSNVVVVDETQVSSQKLDYAHCETVGPPVSPKRPAIQVVGVMSALILAGVVILQVDRLEIPTQPVPTDLEAIGSVVFDLVLVVVAVVCLWPQKLDS